MARNKKHAVQDLASWLPDYQKERLIFRGILSVDINEPLLEGDRVRMIYGPDLLEQINTTRIDVWET